MYVDLTVPREIWQASCKSIRENIKQGFLMKYQFVPSGDASLPIRCLLAQDYSADKSAIPRTLPLNPLVSSGLLA